MPTAQTILQSIVCAVRHATYTLNSIICVKSYVAHLESPYPYLQGVGTDINLKYSVEFTEMTSTLCSGIITFVLM